MNIRCEGCLVAVAIGLCWMALDAFAVAVTPKEVQARKRWVRNTFRKLALPSAFTYDGKPSADLLADWQKKVGNEKARRSTDSANVHVDRSEDQA